MASSTERPGWLLKRAQDALNAAMTAALGDFGATLPQYAVLTALAEEPGLSNADLARRTFVTPQTMNQVLRELEQRGWVSRHPHPGHGRILQAELTDGGRADPDRLPPGGGRGGGADASRARAGGTPTAGRGPAELYRRAQRSVSQPRLVSRG